MTFVDNKHKWHQQDFKGRSFELCDFEFGPRKAALIIKIMPLQNKDLLEESNGILDMFVGD